MIINTSKTPTSLLVEKIPVVQLNDGAGAFSFDSRDILNLMEK